jgi:hypothetical protein
VNFSSNTLSSLIAGSDNSSSPPKIYPAEGGVFVSDLANSLTLQQAQANTLQNYGGFGLVMEAAYNCMTPPCVDSIGGSFVNNSITLTPGVFGTYALVFSSAFPGNALGAVSKGNKGGVKSPSIPELVQAKNGGSLTVQDYNNNISTSGTGNGSSGNLARLHLPKLT